MFNQQTIINLSKKENWNLSNWDRAIAAFKRDIQKQFKYVEVEHIRAHDLVGVIYMPSKVTNTLSERDVRDCIEYYPIQHIGFKASTSEIVSVFGPVPFEYAASELGEFLQDINIYKSESQVMFPLRERQYAIELSVSRTGDSINIATKSAIRVNEGKFGTNASAGVTLEEEFLRLLGDPELIKPDTIYNYELQSNIYSPISCNDALILTGEHPIVDGFAQLNMRHEYLTFELPDLFTHIQNVLKDEYLIKKYQETNEITFILEVVLDDCVMQIETPYGAILNDFAILRRHNPSLPNHIKDYFISCDCPLANKLSAISDTKLFEFA